MQLTNKIKTTLCKTAVAAGQTDITDATAIDMAGYEGCRFIFSFGAITSGAVTSIAVAALATSSPTPETDDMLGTGISVTDGSDNTLYIIDIYKPRLRYLRPHVQRATQDAVLNSIIAEQYGHSGLEPIAKSSTVTAQELHTSPAQGTA